MVFPSMNVNRESYLDKKRRLEAINYYEKEEKAMKYGKKVGGYKCKNKECVYKGSSRTSRVYPSCGVKDPFVK